MLFSPVISALFLVLGTASVFAAPSGLLAVETVADPATEKYIVRFKEGVSTEHLVKSLGVENSYWKHLNGFADHLDTDSLNKLRASPDVLSISQDATIYPTSLQTQTDAPWGIARLTAAGPVGTDVSSSNYTYTYDQSATGEGVDIYVFDSGVNINHTDFGGRARWGYVPAQFQPPSDGSGHGTFCAGVTAGTRYGVAKKANVIAVKVIGTVGGSISDILNGLDWTIDQVKQTKRPSVISMSLGSSSVVASLDAAVAKATNAGIHVVVSAGNEGQDASDHSPAREPSAITVGATNINDVVAGFSNFGPVVEIFAPGVDITSASYLDNTSTTKDSGTSMATPHVAGLVAALISKEGNLSPADMQKKVKSYALVNRISKLPAGTANLLAHLPTQ